MNRIEQVGIGWKYKYIHPHVQISHIQRFVIFGRYIQKLMYQDSSAKRKRISPSGVE